MNCPYCNQIAVKNGSEKHRDGTVIQTYRCKACHKRFNERTATPMARLRTPIATVSRVLKVRTEGLGVRATGRAFELSHSTVMRWEQRIAEQVANWSPPVPKNHDITVEGDELYTRVEQNFPPSGFSWVDN